MTMLAGENVARMLPSTSWACKQAQQIEQAGRMTSSDSCDMTDRQVRRPNCRPDPTDALADVQQHLAALELLMGKDSRTS